MPLLDLAEAKDHLRIESDDTDSDVRIQALIDTLALHLADDWNIVADRASFSWAFDDFSGLMLLPATPVQQDTIAVTYLDPQGGQQTLTDFRVVPAFRSKHFVRLVPAIGGSWPLAAKGAAMITVTADVGFVADPESDDSAAVPANIRHAAKLLLSYFFNNSDAVISRAEVEQVPGVAGLINSYRIWAI
jgi:uncharacterized phiE125 gp8 family phage protein